MVICPVRGTYNDVQISLLTNEKKAFKVTNRAKFGIAKSLYFFQTTQFCQKFEFLPRIVTTRLIWTELTHSTTVVSNLR